MRTKIVTGKFLVIFFIVFCSKLACDALPMARAAGYSWGERHTSWSENDIRNFLNTIDKALLSGGASLRQTGWQGSWHGGQQGYKATDPIRLEYHTKAKFFHPNFTNGRTSSVEIYFWQYHSAKQALRQVDASVQGLQEIHKSSDRYTTYRLLEHRDAGIGRNSHAFEISISTPNARARPRRLFQYIITSGTWHLFAFGSNKEAVAAALSALAHGFNFEDFSRAAKTYNQGWGVGGNPQSKREIFPPQSSSGSSESSVGYRRRSDQPSREDFRN